MLGKEINFMNRAANKKGGSLLHKIEHAIDISIPYFLVILLIITSIDIFYAEMAHEYAYEMEIIDTAIISVFVADLAFKYKRARNFPEFVKFNWIDILAVMPFYMMFRFLDEFILTSEIVKDGQQTIHIADGIEKEAASAAKDAKGAKIVTRSEKMLREVRILSRVQRFAKVVHFFENPKHKHNSLN